MFPESTPPSSLRLRHYHSLTCEASSPQVKTGQRSVQPDMNHKIMIPEVPSTSLPGILAVGELRTLSEIPSKELRSNIALAFPITVVLVRIS